MRIDSQALDTLLASVAADVVTTSIHWRLCRDLWAAVPDFEREMNECRAFWSLTLGAHYEVALFRLGRLYDQDPAALGLRRLLAIVADNADLFSETHFRERLKHRPFVDSLARGVVPPDAATLEADAKSVAGDDPLVHELVATRNCVLAHRDPRVVLGRLQDPAASLDPSKIDSLLGRAASIVNRYRDLFCATSSAMTIVGHDDYRGVLSHIRDDLARKEQLLQEELERPQGRSAG
jgi:hypothetical protein